MKVALSQPQLNQALTQLIKAFDKYSFPHFLIRGSGGNIHISLYGGNNRHFSVAVPVVEAEEEGAIAVPGKLFKEMVSNIPGNDLISLEVIGEDLHINSYVLQGSAGLNQLPSVNLGEAKGSVSFPGALIQRVLSLVSKDETKQALTGVNISVNAGSNIILTATDGHTLSRVTHAVKDSFSMNTTIPAKAFVALGKKGGDITIVEYEEYLVTSYNNFTATHTKFDSRYPDVSKALDDKNRFSCLVNRKSLLDTCKRIKTLSKDAAIRVNISATQITINLVVNEGAVEEKVNFIEPIELSDSPVTIGINIQYLIKILMCMGEDAQVKLTFTDEASPLFLYSPDQQCLLMPVFIR